MTLIACTLNYKRPFIIGDFLITSDKEGAVYVPTIYGDAQDVVKAVNGVRSHSVQLKIHIIKPNVCVALAGDVYEMSCFLDELKSWCSYRDNVDEEFISSRLLECDLDNNFPKLSYLIFIAEEKEDSYKLNNFMRGDWFQTRSDLFEGAFACGTGSHDFLGHLSQLSGTTGGSMMNNGLHYAIVANVCVLVRILAVERFSLQTILNEWGAGFELIYFDNGSFVKLDNISYLIIKGEVDDKGNITLEPQRLMHYKYRDNFLCVHTFEIINSEKEYIDDTIIITSKDYEALPFIVLPINRKEEFRYEELPDFFFETDQVAVGEFIKVIDQPLISSYFATKDPTSVKYNKDGLRITLPIHMYKANSSVIRLTYTELILGKG